MLSPASQPAARAWPGASDACALVCRAACFGHRLTLAGWHASQQLQHLAGSLQSACLSAQSACAGSQRQTLDTARGGLVKSKPARKSTFETMLAGGGSRCTYCRCRSLLCGASTCPRNDLTTHALLIGLWCPRCRPTRPAVASCDQGTRPLGSVALVQPAHCS